eukprot:Gb_04416 [translate_table: standard]
MFTDAIDSGMLNLAKLDFFEKLLATKFLRYLKQEKYAARKAILPLIQAEEDERFVKEWKKALDEEAEIMKNVPGWKVGENVYNSGRWMPPATGQLRPDVW